ncbi:uncharacterized protein EI97DRAFT_464384 [Westerdykella ornata]|uniref:Non-classical export protein 1 n=1 Tax=Westerdykella ornata TaxID=318751 RepID=A0A6A6JUY2_WESOR|nr:uncharacterized protein EI97DRAFT_464384 [Westerdykella ornata]KAF2280430.1 hypothetical protein EI97DRAFT_464384 [Westerdykella ornata]
MAYQYIISKTIDPLFAISIGLAAAVNRIHREEKDAGRTVGQSVEVLKRRVGIAWEGGWRGFGAEREGER